MRPNSALDGFHSWSGGRHPFSTTPIMPDHSAKAEPSTALSSASFGGFTFAGIGNGLKIWIHSVRRDAERACCPSVAQVSKPAVSPTSMSADRGIAQYSHGAGLETCETADLEVCSTRFGH